MRVFVFLVVALGNVVAYAQKPTSCLCESSEQNIYSFETTKGKLLSLCQASDQQYIVYRYGKRGAIELQFPETLDKSSWEQFTYAYQLRGGVANQGLDLNSVLFNVGNTKYEIYQDWSAAAGTSIGVRVNANGQIIDIKGIIRTVTGALMDLRENEFIPQE